MDSKVCTSSEWDQFLHQVIQILQLPWHVHRWDDLMIPLGSTKIIILEFAAVKVVPNWCLMICVSNSGAFVEQCLADLGDSWEPSGETRIHSNFLPFPASPMLQKSSQTPAGRDQCLALKDMGQPMASDQKVTNFASEVRCFHSLCSSKLSPSMEERKFLTHPVAPKNHSALQTLVS